ncbi:MAG: MASE4 domain-containing protein [Alphaproteobacteria bacterium]|nr:MASE4 domain-containing protein [Alphaproteobacteria bacterium]
MTVIADAEKLEDRATIFLSLLPPLGSDRQLALTIAALSAIVFVSLVRFAKEPLAPMPGFIPVYQSALFFSDLITAAVFFGQYSIQHTRALLLLGTAYLFTAFIIVPHTLSFPGLFAPTGVIGSGPQTTVWLYMFWHSGFPLLMMVFTFIKDDDRPIEAPGKALLLSIGSTIVAVLALIVLTTRGHELLPTLLLPDNNYTPAMTVLILGVWGLSLAALAMLWFRRPHNTLDLWMLVVLVAWCCEVGLSSALNAKRFDLGFYSGRAYGLLAATFVLIMLLLETRALYTRLARSLDRERATAERRADTAHRTSLDTAETLRAVIDSSSLSILALSPTGDVLLWNRAAERLFGYESAEVIGQPYPLLPQEEAARAEQAALFERALAGATLKDLRFRCRCKDGSEPDIRGSAAPFYDTAGGIRGVAVALEDITEKNATEEMLRQAQKMEAVGQLTGGVAHDFNNILMVILSNVEEVLEDEALAAEHRDMLSNVAASGQRAAELTRRLLAFSRKQRLMPQATDITELVSSIDKLLRRTLGEQIEIEAILTDDLWITNVDRSQLESALVNLCVNARDAMAGGGRLLIETSNKELDHDYARDNPGVVPGDYVMLAVSDTGSGMPPEVLSKVFEPFFTTKAIGKGTGLGLSMVYGFIKQSNGHIKIYSEVGQGTTIRMYLPRVNAPADDSDRRTAVEMPRGNKEHVLLVEDDDQVRSAVLAQLLGLGYVVTEAANGQAALACLAGEQKFDVMLTDIIMPGIDGPQLAQSVAKRQCAPKLIFMSGYSENAAVHHGRIAADAVILSKPFRKIDLAKRLRETLDS